MGFNEFALKAIKIALKKLPRSLRYGSLVWDEMSLAQSVNFNAQLLKMDGFVDYGGAIKKKYVKHEGQLADHALVFLFRPYRASWVQPIAVFGTKGAAGADVLQQLILKAIVMLEKCNAHVLNVVSDGAQTNKSTYKKFGISGVKDDVRFYIEHPLDPNKKVFFIFDVPHLFKVIRNHLFNHKNVQVSEYRKQDRLLFRAQNIFIILYSSIEDNMSHSSEMSKSSTIPIKLIYNCVLNLDFPTTIQTPGKR